MTSRLTLSLCTLLCCTAASAALAHPVPAHRMAPPAPAAAVRTEAVNQAMEKMLTLRPEQKPLWDAYAKDRLDMARAHDKRVLTRRQAKKDPSHVPMLDRQARLEARAKQAETRATQLKQLAGSRSALLGSLDAGQKAVLEHWEARTAAPQARRHVANCDRPPMPRPGLHRPAYF